MSSTPAFFIPPKDIGHARVTVRDPEHVRQIRKVFRLRVDDAFIALDGRMRAYDCIIRTMEKDVIVGTVEHTRTLDTELPFELIVCSALIKRERYALLLEKCTELGAAAFIPIAAARSPYHSIAPQLQTRWEHIIREAAELVHRGIIPVLRAAETLEMLLSRMDDRTLVVALALDDASRVRVADCPERIRREAPEKVMVLIGPEGDFTNEEYRLLRERNVMMLSLGSRPLRSETAAIAVASILSAATVG